jgi:hypothetical protein
MDGRSAKRIRLACLPCRKKKVRCSGGRPSCALCVRIGRSCIYAEEELGNRTQNESQPHQESSGSTVYSKTVSKVSKQRSIRVSERLMILTTVRTRLSQDSKVSSRR